jgi:hypothetical protein
MLVNFLKSISWDSPFKKLFNKNMMEIGNLSTFTNVHKTGLLIIFLYALFWNFFIGFEIGMKFYVWIYFKFFLKVIFAIFAKSKNVFYKWVLDFNFAPTTRSVLLFSLISQIRCTLM